MADGGFVVSWQTYGQESGSDWDIAGQLFDAQGNAIGSEFLVNTSVTGSQTQAHIAALNDGGFIITWDSSESGVHSQRFNAEGERSFQQEGYFADQAFELNISSDLVDTDGSETLNITVTGLPEDAKLSNGTQNDDGSWTLTSDQLEGLTVMPAPGSFEDFTITVTATSIEGDAAASSASMSVSIPIDMVEGVSPPSIDVNDAAGIEDNAIALELDVESDASTDIFISGLPDGAFLSAGDDQGNGVWQLTQDDLNNLTITPPGDFSGEIN